MLKVNKMINAEEIYNKYHWSGDGDWNFVAVRIQDVPFGLGEIDHISHVWVDGNETDEELAGNLRNQCKRSAIRRRLLRRLCGYHLRGLRNGRRGHGRTDHRGPGRG